MGDPGIKHVACFLPEDSLGNAELKQRFEFKPDFLEVKLGIERRYPRAQGTGDLRHGLRGRAPAAGGER